MFDVLIQSLNTLLVTAIGVERITEIVKNFYLPVKSKVLKKEYTVITPQEKQFISLCVSIVICLSLGIGFNIPGVLESLLVQQLLAATVASVGSNMIHSILGVIIAIKKSIGDIKK
jgi:ABC-type polysaccharide/polyol phosphate export permease